MLSGITFAIDISIHNFHDSLLFCMFVALRNVVFVGLETMLNPLGEGVRWLFDDKCFQKKLMVDVWISDGFEMPHENESSFIKA